MRGSVQRWMQSASSGWCVQGFCRLLRAVKCLCSSRSQFENLCSCTGDYYGIPEVLLHFFFSPDAGKNSMESLHWVFIEHLVQFGGNSIHARGLATVHLLDCFLSLHDSWRVVCFSSGWLLGYLLKCRLHNWWGAIKQLTEVLLPKGWRCQPCPWSGRHRLVTALVQCRFSKGRRRTWWSWRTAWCCWCQ